MIFNYIKFSQQSSIFLNLLRKVLRRKDYVKLVGNRYNCNLSVNIFKSFLFFYLNIGIHYKYVTYFINRDMCTFYMYFNYISVLLKYFAYKGQIRIFFKKYNTMTFNGTCLFYLMCNFRYITVKELWLKRIVYYIMTGI